mmetsp:Transcript_12171/g.28142  ORF Transcript_12171/g.28142 Transcript_12171/m.28142 type:complete len:586 (-) Transcript_12171:57-1814(-)
MVRNDFDRMAESLSAIAPTSVERPTPKRVSAIIGVGLMLNYVLGVGVLNLPYAFAHAGVVLSPCIFIIAASLVGITLIWVLEASARGRGFANVYLVCRVAHLSDPDDSMEVRRLSSLATRWGNAADVSFPVLADSKPNSLAQEVGNYLNPRKLAQLAPRQEPGSVQHLLDHNGVEDDLIRRALRFDLDWNRDLTDALEFKYRSLNHGENKSFELNELLSMFAPAWTVYVYEACITMLLYLGLMSFSTVFGNSMVAKFPVFDWGFDCQQSWPSGCEHSFILWVMLYACVVTGLSLLEVVEMLWFQMLLSGARFFLVALLVFVSLIGLFTDPVDNHSPPGAHSPYLAPSVETWQWSGTMSVLSSAIFSMLITFGVPELITPLKRAGSARSMLVGGLSMISFFYVIVGVLCSLYFGKDNIAPQINITFALFRGGAAPGDAIPWWAQTIAFFVDIFPALDVISMFPLICIALANTMCARLIRFQSLPLNGKQLRILTRLLSALPPALIPLLSRDLEVIIKYAVIPGVYVGLIAPALLQLYSVRACRQGEVSSATPYSLGILSTPPVCIVVVVLGLAFLGANIYTLAVGG